jgi:hypothetical protein
MKLIYVAHPYGGKWRNKRKVERIIRQLIQQYPDYTFYSPIHALGFMYSDIDYDKGMEHCLEILKRCDELWLCGRWFASKGCRIEVKFARQHDIPISRYLSFKFGGRPGRYV